MKSQSNLDLSKDVHPTTLVTLSSDKPFDQVNADLEKQLGKFDPVRIGNSTSLPGTIKEMEGSSGLMIVAAIDMDRALPTFLKEETRARQYLIGNPLIADKMARHEKRAALYAPPRLLVYTDKGRTYISYDQPSTVFGRFPSEEIRRTAEDLDRKFDQLVQVALN